MDLWCNERPLNEEEDQAFEDDDKVKAIISKISSNGGSNGSRDSGIVPDSIPALTDHNLLNDNRVLQKLLFSEDRAVPSAASIIFNKVQNEVQPQMRDILTKWMLEVCEELQCEVIFPSAVNYLDRFLSLVPVSKEEFQLLGSACLLIASKLRQCQSIHPEDLVYYTASTYTVSQITECEMLVLTTLKWDVSTVVSTDFIDHLLVRLHLICEEIDLNPLLVETYLDDIRKVATGLCLLCSREIGFLNEKPSVIATASIACALHSVLSLHGKATPLRLLVSRFEEITGIPRPNINRCLKKLSKN